jgi:hypothetical protein
LLLVNLVIWKEQVVLVVGAASSRDHLISRLEAAPTGCFFIVTWTFRISALVNSAFAPDSRHDTKSSVGKNLGRTALQITNNKSAAAD